jgi:hypothetical protein
VTLRYPYQSFRVRHPLVSLSGRLARPRPVIAVTLIGPSGSRATDALVDPGADDTVFPEQVAVDVGIDLATAPQMSGSGVGRVPLSLRFAEVILRIGTPQEQREWKAWVGFTSAKLRQPLLGYAGFLQFFTATFHGHLEEVELTVNPSYSGT